MKKFFIALAISVINCAIAMELKSIKDMTIEELRSFVANPAQLKQFCEGKKATLRVRIGEQIFNDINERLSSERKQDIRNNFEQLFKKCNEACGIPIGVGSNFSNIKVLISLEGARLKVLYPETKEMRTVELNTDEVFAIFNS